MTSTRGPVSRSRNTKHSTRYHDIDTTTQGHITLLFCGCLVVCGICASADVPPSLLSSVLPCSRSMWTSRNSTSTVSRRAKILANITLESRWRYPVLERMVRTFLHTTFRPKIHDPHTILKYVFQIPGFRSNLPSLSVFRPYFPPVLIDFLLDHLTSVRPHSGAVRRCRPFSLWKSHFTYRPPHSYFSVSRSPLMCRQVEKMHFPTQVLRGQP